MKTVEPWDQGPNTVDQADLAQPVNKQILDTCCLLFLVTCIRDIPHNIIFSQVQPVLAHRIVAVPVWGVGVGNHLRLPCGPTSEVDLDNNDNDIYNVSVRYYKHLHDVILVSGHCFMTWVGGVIKLVPIQPSCPFSPDYYLCFQFEQTLVQLVNFPSCLWICYDTICIGSYQTASDILLLEYNQVNEVVWWMRNQYL